MIKFTYVKSIWFLFYSERSERRRCFITIRFKIALKYAIRKVKGKQKSLELNENISSWLILTMLICCVKT